MNVILPNFSLRNSTLGPGGPGSSLTLRKGTTTIIWFPLTVVTVILSWKMTMILMTRPLTPSSSSTSPTTSFPQPLVSNDTNVKWTTQVI